MQDGHQHTGRVDIIMASALPDSITKQRESRTWEVGICEGERVDPLAPAAAAAHVGRHERVLLRRDVINLQQDADAASMSVTIELNLN